MSKKKRNFVIIGIVALIIAFGILNAVWFTYSKGLEKYVKNIPDDGFGVYVVNDDADNSYSYKFPHYLEFVGNMALMDKDLNTLIVWTPLIGPKKYGVQLILEHDEVYEMLLDKDGNLIADQNLNDAQDVYDEHREIIQQLYHDASEFWGEDFY